MPSGSARTGYWLLAIVALGAGLRFFPLWFGLPYLPARPDEEAAVGLAIGIQRGDLNPHFFHWPSLTLYVFAALYAAAKAIRRALSIDPALTSVEHLLIARGVVALAGTLTIVVLFRLARRTADTATGLLAALFLAVAILHVRDSHFAMTDVLMTLLLTASLALLLRAVDGIAQPASTRGLRWFSAAGLVGGLAASTKYSAAALIAGMGAAQVLWLASADRKPWTPGAFAPSALFLGAFALGFLAGTPYALLDSQTFAADLRFDFTHLSGGHGVHLGRGWYYHLARSLPYGVGVIAFAAAVAGLVPFVRHHRRHAFVLGTFAAAFYLSIGSGYTVFFRYVLPLVPIVCLLAAIGVRRASPWLAARTGVSLPVTVGLLTALVAGPGLVNSAWFDLLLARTDTRVLAGNWLTSRLKPEESLHDAGGEYVRLDLRDARFHQWSFDPAANSFGHPEGRVPDWLVLYESPLRLYASTAAPLRQLATEKYDLVHTVRATKGRAASAVYDPQDAFFMPVSGFSTIERPGPTIRIYRRRDAAP